MSELLAPAGNLEKLETVCRFGADAAYIGLKNFSLRKRADNFFESEATRMAQIKGGRRLYGALNIYFHNSDLNALFENREFLAACPLDGFIVSDPGIVEWLQTNFPERQLHLSTQANCLNREAAKFYRRLGFSRIVLGRETSLDEIKEIKDAVPDLELEVFVHGAMCLAYSGRCFLSRFMTNRSANGGDCAHSCRWEYRVLEEKERPGEFFPVEADERYTAVLSSKDLCLLHDLKTLQDAGVDSFKIEGRMKSIYYAAVVTRAYRKTLDALSGAEIPDLAAYQQELEKVSHREFTRGFLFDDGDETKTTGRSYIRRYRLLGKTGEPTGDGRFALKLYNRLTAGEEIEWISPSFPFKPERDYSLTDEEGRPLGGAGHGQTVFISSRHPIASGDIIRKKEED